MAVELEVEVRSRIAHPVEMPLQLDNTFARIEPHRLDQIKLLGVAPHEIPLQQALGPFIAWDAVDDKP